LNDKYVDELCILDINATSNQRPPSIDVIQRIASEAFMPVSYGGGIKNLEHIREVLRAGVEKVILGTVAYENPELIYKASREFGSQSIVVSVDIKRKFWKGYGVFVRNGKVNTGFSHVEYSKRMQEYGAGELIVTDIDNEGTMAGYDVELFKEIANFVNIPVIANGGARNPQDLIDVITKAQVSAAAAGSIFVYYGSNKAVLINYPHKKLIEIGNNI
jgi:imidazole glycerol-phosphate synthase subunit HisF